MSLNQLFCCSASQASLCVGCVGCVGHHKEASVSHESQLCECTNEVGDKTPGMPLSPESRSQKSTKDYTLVIFVQW